MEGLEAASLRRVCTARYSPIQPPKPTEGGTQTSPRRFLHPEFTIIHNPSFPQDFDT